MTLQVKTSIVYTSDFDYSMTYKIYLERHNKFGLIWFQIYFIRHCIFKDLLSDFRFTVLLHQFCEFEFSQPILTIEWPKSVMQTVLSFAWEVTIILIITAIHYYLASVRDLEYLFVIIMHFDDANNLGDQI